MGKWWKNNKPIVIMLGIVGILLALILVPAISRLGYEGELGAESQFAGQANIEVLAKVITPEYWGSNISVAFTKNFTGYINALKIAAIVYVGLWVIIILKTITKGQYENIEHGSADWCSNSEAYSVLSPKSGMVLADKFYLPIIPDAPKGKNGNILVIGGSGAGKSASFVIPNALQMLGSYIFTDPKGELYDRTAGIFRQKGYKVHVINLVDPKCSDGYNPLAHIRGTLDVDTIAKIISNKEGGDKKSSDPFWDQTSEALLKAAIYYIMFKRPEEERSLASCAALIRYGSENEGENLRELFMQLDSTDPARKAFDTIRLGSEKTFSNILVSLAAKLEAFDSQEIAAMTSTNTIEFEELVDERSVLYFITPATNDTYNFLMNIFFSQMLDRLYNYADEKGGHLPTPLFLILDEFANIGRIPRFEQILSTCRSYRINISIILQSIDQLIAIYDEKVTENIMANCSTHLFLGSNAQKTLETFSKQLGEATIKHDNVSRSTDKDSNTSGRSYSDQIMARALMTPDELRRMDTNTCIILFQAMKPIKAQKYFYFSMHPLWEIAKKVQEDHRAIAEPKRGTYTITNPFNINNYDDLFAPKSSTPSKSISTSGVSNDSLDLGIDTTGVKPATATVGTRASKSKIDTQPVINAVDGMDNYDLQAELEKKFDELFGGGSSKKNNVVN